MFVTLWCFNIAMVYMAHLVPWFSHHIFVDFPSKWDPDPNMITVLPKLEFATGRINAHIHTMFVLCCHLID